MNHNVYFEIKGLYPEERDYIIVRLELIKDKLYPDLNIEFSMLKRSPNRVWIDYSCDRGDAVKLYGLLDAITVPNIRTEYDGYIPLDCREIPSVVLCLRKDGEFADFNVDKGLYDYDG